jgi:hypothetical protein
LLLRRSIGSIGKHVNRAGLPSRQEHPLSFVAAGVIGLSFLISGLLECHYWLATFGGLTLLGSIIRLRGAMYGRSMRRRER